MIFMRRSLKRFTSGMESRKRSHTAIPTPFVVIALPKYKTLKLRPMSPDLLPDHLVSCNAHKSILRLVKNGLLDGKCSEATKLVYEDLFVGYCLSIVGAAVMDGADANGAHRFLPVAVWDYLHPSGLPNWLNQTSVAKLKPSYACCSPHFMTMNYAPNSLQYLADYLLHRLKPFGVDFQ
ncbi:unnamed protein product [Nippostrongylus brasiliensis]|uniref:Wsv419-like protein n=1 Tax=Nippostrongylus brasiliensis TaxID=27835 RepID=A0A0N4YLB5_NIPBR|nr:unnamed protein product [Nippostrongylus brasiliensis]